MLIVETYCLGMLHSSLAWKLTAFGRAGWFPVGVCLRWLSDLIPLTFQDQRAFGWRERRGLNSNDICCWGKIIFLKSVCIFVFLHLHLHLHLQVRCDYSFSISINIELLWCLNKLAKFKSKGLFNSLWQKTFPKLVELSYKHPNPIPLIAYGATSI